MIANPRYTTLIEQTLVKEIFEQEKRIINSISAVFKVGSWIKLVGTAILNVDLGRGKLFQPNRYIAILFYM
jgi:hypothetical protein